MKITKFFSHFFLFLVLCSIGELVNSQTIEEQLKECSKIQVSLIRLQCYDRLTQDPVASQPAKTARKKFRLRRKSNQAEQVAADAGTEVQSQGSTAAGRVGQSDESTDQFGKERMAKSEDEDTDQITSRILGEFKGWSGYTEFKLENGQLWQQSSEGLLIVRINNPTVIIKKSFFGTYNLSLEGVNSTIKVRRIQ